MQLPQIKKQGYVASWPQRSVEAGTSRPSSPWLAPARLCRVLNAPVPWEYYRSWTSGLFFWLHHVSTMSNAPPPGSCRDRHLQGCPQEGWGRLSSYSPWKFRKPKESQLDLLSVWPYFLPSIRLFAEKSPRKIANGRCNMDIIWSLLPVSYGRLRHTPYTPQHHCCCPKPAHEGKTGHPQSHCPLSFSITVSWGQKDRFPLLPFQSEPHLHETLIRLANPA